MSAIVKQLETKIGNIYNSAPPLPEDSKKALVDAWPWIALVFGFLQIYVAWSLWGAIRYLQKISDVTNSLNIYYSNAAAQLGALDRSTMYLGIVVLLIDGILLLMAHSELKKRSRKGWDLIFLASLINLGYAFVSIFINGFSGFIFSALGSAVGFYLLFQVKSKYTTLKG